MKITASTLILLLSAPQYTKGQCLPESFKLMVKGCDYDQLILSIQQELNYPDPQTQLIIPCPHGAADELVYHLPVNASANELITEQCKNATDEYYNNNVVSWSDVTLKGYKFDKEYYDGNGDWNEEHQSNYPHPPVIPGEASNVLNRDAERVDDLYENHLQRYPLQWPGMMSNFANCQLQSAMCCWVSDRQANDNNGNCATPYDERCVDADPGDNTDLCFVDMSRSGDSAHVNDGFAIFHDNDEGPVHCHGLAWGQDEGEADFRYRANNLFYVSMSDHLHDRGYVRSVQGAPMCACVENMPVVSRSDCTEISAKEFFKFSFDTSMITVSLDYVDINFNACQASKNNNLERFVQRLRDEGRLSWETYHKFREIVVGDNQCPGAIRDHLFDRGYNFKTVTANDFNPPQNGYCVKANGSDQNSGVIKILAGDYGQDQASKDKCLEACASYSSEHRVTACEAIHSRSNRGCYLHTLEVLRGNGVSNHVCWVLNLQEPKTLEQFLPTMNGYCLDSFDNDQNTGVIKIYGGDFGPEESKQMECVEKCIAATAILTVVTGCEAIWDQSNRGCYIHTKEVVKGNGVQRHSCWVL